MILGMPVENSCEFINITPVNPYISKCNIKVCYVQDTPNRNGSVITKDVAKDMAKSLPGSPIVGFYNRDKGDFEGHNVIIKSSGNDFEILDGTRPYGFVDLNAKIWFQDFSVEGSVKTFLMTEGYIWTGVYPESERILSLGNNHSMEIDIISSTSVCDDEQCFLIINEALIKKLCILGQDVEPCFEGANIVRAEFSVNDLATFVESFTQKFSALTEKLQNTIKEGGKSDMDKQGVKYNLEEISEYQDLLTKYSNLEKELDTVKQDFSATIADLNTAKADLSVANEALSTANEELTALKNFKLEIEKKEKIKMIESFSVLSDEDKKEVLENIDKYSVDEIESKLAVICVRKKVNFNLEEEENKEKPSGSEGKNANFSFNVDTIDSEMGDKNFPAWLKAVKSNKEKKLTI